MKETFGTAKTSSLSAAGVNGLGKSFVGCEADWVRSSPGDLHCNSMCGCIGCWFETVTTSWAGIVCKWNTIRKQLLPSKRKSNFLLKFLKNLRLFLKSNNLFKNKYMLKTNSHLKITCVKFALLTIEFLLGRCELVTLLYLLYDLVRLEHWLRDGFCFNNNWLRLLRIAWRVRVRTHQILNVPYRGQFIRIQWIIIQTGQLNLTRSWIELKWLNIHCISLLRWLIG